jgi:hypothetical protein
MIYEIVDGNISDFSFGCAFLLRFAYWMAIREVAPRPYAVLWEKRGEREENVGLAKNVSATGQRGRANIVL